jgi:hypothetical protein
MHVIEGSFPRYFLSAPAAALGGVQMTTGEVPLEMYFLSHNRSRSKGWRSEFGKLSRKGCCFLNTRSSFLPITVNAILNNNA